MDEDSLSREDVETICELREQQENAHKYTPRPKSQRILAWILFGLMVVGIFFYCYWQMTPPT